jgi:hypothetical protein
MIVTLTLLVGCANAPPKIGDVGVDLVQYDQDLAKCQAYSDGVDVAGHAASTTLRSAAGSAGLGAAFGMAPGFSVGRSAGFSALFGGIVGGITQLTHAAKVKKDALEGCLTRRGYNVLVKTNDHKKFKNNHYNFGPSSRQGE